MTETNSKALEKAIIGLLRPIVRLVLKRGMAFGRFVELVKRAYVDVAETDFAVPSRKLSISRVAVLTGLTRKESSRLMQLERDADEAAVRGHVNRAARVVSAWADEAVYHDEQGEPALLPFESGSSPSFTDLVQAHGGDVGPRAVLDELKRVGAIDRLEDGRVQLRERAYIPMRDEEAKLEILGSDVADLVASIDHNLDPEPGQPFFQRKVAYDNLASEYLPVLRARLSQSGQALLEELNADMAKHDRDVREEAETGPGSRAMIGIYYYEEANDADESDD